MAVGTNEAAFVMHGARAAVSGGMLHFEEQVKAFELAVVENTGLAFDLARTLVESACKTILPKEEARSTRTMMFRSFSKQQRRPFLSFRSLWRVTLEQGRVCNKRSVV